MRPFRAAVASVCGAVVVVGLAAPAAARQPAQATPTPVDQWADSVCGTLDDWNQDIHSAALDADSPLKKARKLKGTTQTKKVKQVVLKLVDETLGSSMRTESDLRGAGEPAVANGADVERALADGFHEQVVIFLDSSRNKVKEVSTKDPVKALKKLLSVHNAIGGDTESVISSLLNDALGIDTSATVRSAIESNIKCAGFQPIL
jgi:hypothetical protein